MPQIPDHGRMLTAAVCFAASFLVASCERQAAELRLIQPRLEFDAQVATEFADLLDAESSVNVEVVPSVDNTESEIDALLAGRADIALISNAEPFHRDIQAVMPLYSNVLHIGYTQDTPPASVFELLNGTAVFAGPPGSPSRTMLDDLSQSRFGVDEINYIELDEFVCPDVTVVYAPISPGLLKQLPSQCKPLKLYSIVEPEMIGSGSIVDAATLLNPHLEAFVIPAGTYPAIDPSAGPIVTFAVDKVLAAHRDVPEHVVYDLTSEVLRLRPALAASLPGLFQSISEDFDAADSTFMIHQGARDFLQRDAPSIYERYSGVAEVLVTIIIGLLSGTIAMIRIYNIRRKNRIDVFYKDAIALRDGIDGQSTPFARKVAIDKMRELQSRAFDMLVDEKVAADESFRIFITLSNDIIDDLRRDAG
ncbi:MAG: hypothetical protein KJO31_04780 [Gammaproteobacteria bacterium]|nr:hypothetical protein [Gammaproteobacteria bacterium]